MMNKLKIIFIGIAVILTTLIVIINNGNTLELFKNTPINNKNRIEKIIRLLDYDKSKFTFDVIENSLNINYTTELVNYKNLEKNASILFYLISDLKIINYKIGAETYSFRYDKIALIYNDFIDINIDKINKRYTNKNFSKVYLGNIGGKIDLFDTSDLCLDNYIELLRNDEFVYHITCSSIDSVIVVNDNREYKLLESLEKGIINIDDLMNVNLKISKEKVNNENIG